jgi:hypothetical protein
MHNASVPLAEFRVQKEEKASILCDIVDNRGVIRRFVAVVRVGDLCAMIYLGMFGVIYVIAQMKQ